MAMLGLYRGRVEAVSRPYCGRIVAVSWRYRGHCYFPNSRLILLVPESSTYRDNQGTLVITSNIDIIQQLYISLLYISVQPRKQSASPDIWKRGLQFKISTRH